MQTMDEEASRLRTFLFYEQKTHFNVGEGTARPQKTKPHPYEVGLWCFCRIWTRQLTEVLCFHFKNVQSLLPI